MINSQNNKNYYLQILVWLVIGIILGSLAGGTYIHNLNSSTSSTQGNSNAIHYYAFVFSGLSSNVSVIDRISNTLLYSQNIEIDADALDVILVPDSNDLHVIPVHQPNVYVIDKTNFDIKYIIPAGSNLQHSGVVTNDGELILLVSRDDQSLVLINTNNNIVEERIKVGNSPHDVALSYNDNYAYVSNVESQTISIIDVNTKLLVNEIQLNIEPHMLITTNNDEQLVITSETPNSVMELNISDQIVTNSIMFDSAPHDISFSTKYNIVLVALPNEDLVAVVDLNNFELTKKINVGKYPHSMNISPDGLYIYVSNTGDDSVSVIDLKQLTVVSTISVGEAPTDIVFYLPNSNSASSLNNNDELDDDSETEFDASHYTCGAYIHVRD